MTESDYQMRASQTAEADPDFRHLLIERLYFWPVA